MDVKKSGTHIVSIMQRDKRKFGTDYSDFRLIVFQLNDKSNLEKGVKFICGTKSYCQRDGSLKLKNIDKGKYMLYVDFDWASSSC